jgi:hypothetical protein
LSHKPRPIKVVDTALSESTMADEIASETAKTGKVTAVVMIMSIFKKQRCKLRSTNLGNERLSCQKAERAIFPEENTRGLRSPSQKLRKGRIPMKLAPKSKKLEPNCTNLMLNSKNICSDRAKMPDPSISSGLYVKNKTIRVLLDSGSIEIYTDASSTQLGAVITQDNRPIAFFSRKFSKTQQKYSVTEIELLAIVETLKEFKGMLWGQDIKVYTDQKNLTRDALGLTSDRVYCWRSLLEEYAPEIIHHKP